MHFILAKRNSNNFLDSRDASHGVSTSWDFLDQLPPQRSTFGAKEVLEDLVKEQPGRTVEFWCVCWFLMNFVRKYPSKIAESFLEPPMVPFIFFHSWKHPW